MVKHLPSVYESLGLILSKKRKEGREEKRKERTKEGRKKRRDGGRKNTPERHRNILILFKMAIAQVGV